MLILDATQTKVFLEVRANFHASWGIPSYSHSQLIISRATLIQCGQYSCYVRVKMTSDPSKNKEKVATKISQRYVDLKSFYNKHFPTDRKTYNLRLPFVGLVLSILSLHFLSTYFAVRYYLNDSQNYILKYCYIFVATCLSYELYYGLKIGDRKQFTPWILFKFIEVCLVFVTIIYVIVDRWYRLEDFASAIIYGIFVFIFNYTVTHIVTSSSVKQFRGYKPESTAEDNIYDNYSNV